MRSSRRHVALAGSLLLAGCASFQLEPVPLSHPAHPGASAAPEPPRSTTLAYAPSDIPSRPPASAAPPLSPDHAAAAGTADTVVGEGEVIATVPGASQIVLEHGEIPGFMEAMTMGYRLDPPSLLDRLKPGDTVRFTIDVRRRAIIGIEKLR
jgi:Cu/Ag efflux protein CusF